MLAEAAERLLLRRQRRARCSPSPSGPRRARRRARSTAPAFLAAIAVGMALVCRRRRRGRREAIHEAIALAESSPELRDDLQLLPWLAVGPLFLRETAPAARCSTARSRPRARARRSAALPFVLNLIARDQATTDRWAVAEATYREAIALARESGQRTDLVFGLAGSRGWRRAAARSASAGRCAAEALALCDELGTRLHEVWAHRGAGRARARASADAAAAPSSFERQQQLLDELGITDVDLSPAPELVDAYLRLGRGDEAARARRRIHRRRPRPRVSRGRWRGRCAAQGCSADDAELADLFEQALRLHERTPDVFEAARTRLAYGERLRRARNRVRRPRTAPRGARDLRAPRTRARGPSAPAPSSQRPARRSGAATRARSTS